MPAYRGRKMSIQIGDGTSPPTFTVVAGIRTKDFSIGNELVDITNSDSGSHREGLVDAGISTLSVSGSGVFKDDTTNNSLEDLANSRAFEDFRLQFENSDYYEGRFQVTSFRYAGAYNTEQTFDVSLESVGPWTFVRNS